MRALTSIRAAIQHIAAHWRDNGLSNPLLPLRLLLSLPHDIARGVLPDCLRAEQNDAGGVADNDKAYVSAGGSHTIIACEVDHIPSHHACGWKWFGCMGWAEVDYFIRAALTPSLASLPTLAGSTPPLCAHPCASAAHALTLHLHLEVGTHMRWHSKPAQSSRSEPPDRQEERRTNQQQCVA